MGGNAFSEQLPDAVFPRMPPAFYNSLKARIIPRLETLYHRVVVPPEAPGKLDHGDLDILVCHPKNVKEGISLSECTTVAEIEQALGSAYSIPLPGDRTSNFAIPIQQDEIQYFVINQDEVEGRKVDTEQLYVQVDLHFCEDVESLESRLLFHSYGELGMILGMLARTVGLTWTTSGLKVFRYDTYIPNPPHIHLTSSQIKIFEFFGLPLHIHERGFTTTQEIFDWIASSRFFNPQRLVPAMKSLKFKGERKMCREFLGFLGPLTATSKISLDVKATQDKALSVFGKRKEFDDTVRDIYLFCEVKKVFSGSLVKEWAEISYWKDVKIVTDAMRVRVLEGIDAADRDWRVEMIKLSVEERRALALELREELIPRKSVEESHTKGTAVTTAAAVA